MNINGTDYALPTDPDQLKSLSERMLNILSNMVDDYKDRGFVDHNDINSARFILTECQVIAHLVKLCV